MHYCLNLRISIFSNTIFIYIFVFVNINPNNSNKRFIALKQEDYFKF